jgi:hypothetical protein
MDYMFNEATIFNQSLATFDTSNVTKMRFMFATDLRDNTSVFSVLGMQFNQPLTNFDMSKVVDNTGMFYQATQFTFPKPEEIPVQEEEQEEIGKAMVSKYAVLEKYQKDQLFFTRQIDKNQKNNEQIVNATQASTTQASPTPVMNTHFTISMTMSINSV